MGVESFSTECSSGHHQEKGREEREERVSKREGEKERKERRKKGGRERKKRMKEKKQKARREKKLKLRKEEASLKGGKGARKRRRKSVRNVFVSGPLEREIEPLSALQNLEEAVYFLESPEAKQFQECLAKPFGEG